jgi:hypothetical protein
MVMAPRHHGLCSGREKIVSAMAPKQAREAHALPRKASRRSFGSTGSHITNLIILR